MKRGESSPTAASMGRGSPPACRGSRRIRWWATRAAAGCWAPSSSSRTRPPSAPSTPRWPCRTRWPTSPTATGSCSAPSATTSGGSRPRCATASASSTSSSSGWKRSWTRSWRSRPCARPSPRSPPCASPDFMLPRPRKTGFALRSGSAKAFFCSIPAATFAQKHQNHRWEPALIKSNPLHRALALAFAAPALTVFAADPSPDAAPAQVAQVQAQAQPQGAQSSPESKEKIEVSAQRQHYRGDVAAEDVPQAVQVISAETIKQIGATKLNDVLDLAADVSRQNTFGGLWDGFAIRGFAGDLNVPSGYLVNGFNGGRGFGGLRDTSSIERLEVIKGPGSSLFGRGEPGGTVSITTKRPQFHPEGSVSSGLGSYKSGRLEGDYTTPINDWTAVRINGAFEDADSYRDTVHTKREFASPSILSKLSNDTSIWYELE